MAWSVHIYINNKYNNVIEVDNACETENRILINWMNKLKNKSTVSALRILHKVKVCWMLNDRLNRQTAQPISINIDFLHLHLAFLPFHFFLTTLRNLKLENEPSKKNKPKQKEDVNRLDTNPINKSTVVLLFASLSNQMQIEWKRTSNIKIHSKKTKR